MTKKKLTTNWQQDNNDLCVELTKEVARALLEFTGTLVETHLADCRYQKWTRRKNSAK